MKRNLILIATTAATFCAAPLTNAQEGGADPYVGVEAVVIPYPASPNKELERPISVRYEVFSLSRAEAAKLMRTNPADDKLYQTMVKMVSEETAAQEVFSIIRCLSGQKATSQAITEMTYPTEWEPPELPNTIGVQISPPRSGKEATPPTAPNTEVLKNAPRLDELPSFKTPGTPTAFETRNVGLTLEIEASQKENGLIDLRIAPEHVRYIGRDLWGQGLSTANTAKFETQSLILATTIRPGAPHLLGTMNPSATSELSSDLKRQVWFAFVTMTPVN